jgi:hypothetical protein
MNNPKISPAPTARPAEKGWLPLGSSLYEFVFTFWTGLSFYIMFATGASSGGISVFLLFLPLSAGTGALLWMTRNMPVIARVDPLLSVSVFAFVCAILASYIFNYQRYDLLFMFGNIISTLILFAGLYVITTKIEFDFRKALILQCLTALPLLPPILATSVNQWGRIVPAELQANYVCMVAMLSFIGACSVRSWIWTVILSILPLYTIVIMQSRDSLLAALIVACIFGYFHFRRIGWRQVRGYAVAAVIGTPIVCIGLYFAGIDVSNGAVAVFDNVTLVNDKYRGISSGGSGRTELWDAAINLFMTHPVFGVGFKGHQLMMPEQDYAHNAYLGTLADMGLFGFISYIFIVGIGLYATFSRGNRGLSGFPQRAAVLISYLIYGMLEPRAFGFGNAYSVLFLLVVFDSSRIPVIDARPVPAPRAKAKPVYGLPAPTRRVIPWHPTAR